MVTPSIAPKICSYFSKRKAADISLWNLTASILIYLNKIVEILENIQNLKTTECKLKMLFGLITTETHFRF